MPIVSVLWAMALLAAAALSLVAAGRVEYALAHDALATASDDAVAEAVTNRAVLALLDPRPASRWRTDGVPQDFSFGDRRVRVAIQDELGRIDLNQADGSLLLQLLQSVGVGTGAAQSLVDKILDWRDPGPMRRLNGAKSDEYRAAGYSYGPRNGAFQSVDELRLVIGMTPEIFAQIEPALTVYSGHPRFDPRLAPREALRALPGMDDAKIDALVSARTLANAYAGPVGDLIGELRGRAFEIRSELARNDRTVERDVTIRLSGNPDQPYWVLNRQRR
ncbi:MAG TPA: type II secretion system protein GspK [Xanthobacteraceae bacterium]|nr:type II secretion system protein GspK [Xanthobacteraceae bacterium]